jgi:sn-glycerol 3-phosphate transport system substrate-binding protein
MMWHHGQPHRGDAKFPFGVAMLPASKQRGSPTGGGSYLFKDHPEPRPRSPS